MRAISEWAFDAIESRRVVGRGSLTRSGDVVPEVQRGNPYAGLLAETGG